MAKNPALAVGRGEKLPVSKVAALIAKVREQAEPQIKPKASAE